ncbi:MAG: DUF3575 domain-containing protein [Bernardetiaceae bacterium]|jgi:hypothetical protein|nr:DUF3575 domain-containing protein [Bernardetiaceae bacterium]
MIRAGLTFIFLVISWLSVLAQAVDPEPVPVSPGHRWVAKLAPFTLFDQEPTIQLALERAWTTRWSGQLELGYGWFNPITFIGVYDGTQISTWRLRPEVRYYFARAARANYRPAPQGIYLALEGLVKNVTMDRLTVLDRGAYLEEVPHTAQRWVGGGHFKLGIQSQVGRRVYIDGYFGFGARHIRVTDPDNPFGASALTRIDFFRLPLREAGQLTAGSIALGFKIGYGF